MTGDLLADVLDGGVDDYALICRTDRDGARTVLVLTGEVSHPTTLDAVGLDGRSDSRPGRSDVLAAVPYRQLTERGYPVPDDGTPLIAMAVTDEERHPLSAALARLPHRTVRLREGRFEPADDVYERTVEAVLRDEIGTGQGSNFVIKRTYVADITSYTPSVALSVFRELLTAEQGAYWTFLLRSRGVTLVGASPERHVGLAGEVALMNPISGTYRYPPGGPTLQGVTEFLADRKEAEELYMVVDEELKMMCRFCAPGTVRVLGPHLKEMARVAHTEYHIEGRTTRSAAEVLRETLFAPTVTGSPVENAARVIARHEPEGRGYYSGVIALAGTGDSGERTLDSAILCRTAAIDPGGGLSLSVGSTLVRHSTPAGEAAETRAKGATLLAAFGEGEKRPSFATHPEVRAALAGRNDSIADFWTDTRPGVGTEDDHGGEPGAAAGATAHTGGSPVGVARSRLLDGHKALVVDAEDTFTSMLEHQLRALGLSVAIRRFDESFETSDYDLVVLGPGPGDPRDVSDPKIEVLERTAGELLAWRRPFVAVCLSHQVLCRRLGLSVVRRAQPNQGVQRRIDLFGSSVLAGFYNTFEARSFVDLWTPEGAGGPVEVSRDPATGGVHALRGHRFASLQFHAESLLTAEGPRTLTATTEWVLGT